MPTFDWNEEENTPKFNKLGAGFHNVRITRCLTERKDGSKIMSKSGDPQLGVVFTNESGEYTEFFPVSGKLTWKLKKLVQAISTRQERNEMTFGPEQFMFPHAQEKYLIGRYVGLDLVANGPYMNAKFEKAELPGEDEEIPF